MLITCHSIKKLFRKEYGIVINSEYKDLSEYRLEHRLSLLFALIMILREHDGRFFVVQGG